MGHDIVIVGGGPAGLTAAVYACRAGRSVLVLEQSVPGGQAALAASIENLPGLPPTAGAAFSSALHAQAAGLGAEIRLERAEGAERTEEGFLVTVAGGKSCPCRALILANGVRRRALGVPGERALSGRGVSWCAACDAPLYRGQAVAVVGGGSAALEEALALSRVCSAVHLIHRRETFRGEELLARRVREAENITLHLGFRVTAILGDERVVGIRLEGPEGKKKRLMVSGVFPAVGMEADNAPFAHLVPLTEEGYYDVGEDCCASPGVFAAGDARRKSLRQIVTAAADGARAAVEADRYLAGLG